MRHASPIRKRKRLIVAGMNATSNAGRDDYSYAVIAQYSADPTLNGKSIPEATRLGRGSDTSTSRSR